MGYDQTFSYKKLCLLSLYIQNGAKFIGTNPDKYTMSYGFRMPGCGSMLACLEAASGRKPEIVGKPNEFILDFLIDKEKLTR
jgi:4-nitrophenyl phosphatase